MPLERVSQGFKDVSMTFQSNPLNSDLIGLKNATAIARAVRKEFGISEQECDNLLQQAEDAQHEATDLFRFISKLNEKFGHKERLRLIEMLWYVVYSDGNLHPYESNLIQRIAGMLHVTDKERAEARHRVLSE